MVRRGSRVQISSTAPFFMASQEYQATDYANPAYWGPEENIKRGGKFAFYSNGRYSNNREIRAGASALRAYIENGGRGMAIERLLAGQPFDVSDYSDNAIFRLREEVMVWEGGYPIDLRAFKGIEPPPRHTLIDDYAIELVTEAQGKPLAYGSFVCWGVVTYPRKGGPRFNSYILPESRPGKVTPDFAGELTPSFTVGDTHYRTNSEGDVDIQRVTELHICTLGVADSLPDKLPGLWGRPETA